MHSFKGDLFHTAAYPEGFDLKDKRVAVIGSGSSGIQLAASIHNEVSHLYTWVRSPIWITSAFAQRFSGKDGQNFDCTLPSAIAGHLIIVADTPEQKSDFDFDREKYHRYKKCVEHELNQRFKLALRNTAESDEANAVRDPESA